MQVESFIILYVSLTAISSWAKIIDLSHKLGPKTFGSPGSAPYNRTKTFDGDYAPGVSLETADLTTGEHMGTHMDAPSHFFKTFPSLDEIPLENLILNGVMIDCSTEVNGSADYVMPLQKLHDWEDAHGRIPDGGAIVINFNWSSRFETPTEYVQSEDFSDFKLFRYPTISAEAARWMVHERNAKQIAVDTPSPDKPNFGLHLIILGEKRTLVENIRDPGRLPTRGFRLHTTPVAFMGAGGAPVRIYAITEDEYSSGKSGEFRAMVSLVCVTTAWSLFLTRL